LEQADQGSGEVAIPGGVQKMCRRGASGRGLAGMVVLEWRLDLMILEVFSNLWFWRRGILGQYFRCIWIPDIGECKKDGVRLILVVPVQDAVGTSW